MVTVKVGRKIFTRQGNQQFKTTTPWSVRKIDFQSGKVVGKIDESKATPAHDTRPPDGTAT